MSRLLADLPEQVVLTLLIWGESRGEPVEGQIAVASVVSNRQRHAMTWKEVCLAPKQFSCFNATDPNFPKIQRAADALMTGELTPELKQAQWIAEGVMHGCVQDNTHGARNYLTTELLHRKPPSWAVDRPILARFGAHSFLIA